jgi:hypothetical protein
MNCAPAKAAIAAPVLRCIEDYLRGQRHQLDTIYTDASVSLLG